ncbi:MAG: AsmA family protein, partial [Desulfuromonadales bacterium]|nr:AsmA family protein [Desulfuromonadales bacterium]
MASRKTISYWLLGCVAVVTTLLLILPQLIDSDTLKAKLQTTVETQIGGQFNFQQVELSFLPRPSITLRQVKLDIPEQVQGTVGTIQLYPELYALLTGQVHLAKLILDSPEVSLNLPAVDTNKEEPPSTLTFSTLQNNLTEVLVPLAKAAPKLALVLNDGTLSINQEQQTLGLANNLNLTLKLAAAPHTSLQVNLQLSASDVTLHRDGHQSIIEGLALNGTLRADEKRISLSIDNLALVRPALQIKGELKSVPASLGFEVDLQAAGLDVDEIRKMALAIAGDTSPVKEIFDYLRGGTVPQISFHSQGETASELGDLKNILIKGHLQEGAVSIPEIKLDLTEVNGDVLIKGGILEGSGMSTRLEGASGSDGALKISLIEGNDLFQLELILDADLGQAQKILKRIVGDPAFGQEIDKITKLSGNSTGKLVLGDSLNDINARVDLTVSNMSADYQDLPFPVAITTGHISFAEDLIKLKGLNGTFGSSVF